MNKLIFDRPVLNPPRFHDEPWELAHDWTVVFRGEYYHLPGGFETDGASIPRPLWWICGTPLEVPRLFAALVHDYIYGGNDPEATRADADDLYRDLQIALGVPRWKCYVEWAALRLFGKSHWSNRKESNPMKPALLLLLSACCLSALLVGCATKTRNVEIDGMFVQAESATLALGSVDVMAAPVGEESAIIKYGEDTAWLHPETKTHSIRIQLTGSNCVEKVDSIVDHICQAFIPAAAIVNGIGTTNICGAVRTIPR